MTLEASDVRRQVREALDRARRSGADRRQARTRATEAWERIRTSVVEPTVQQVAGVLRSEGYPFTMATPGSSVRLQSERSGDDFVEISLDTTGSMPEVMARIARAKGRETILEDRPVKPGHGVETIAETDVLELLVEAIGVLVEK